MGGHLNEVVYDPTNTQPWTSIESAYDSAQHLLTRAVDYDNGRSDETRYDTLGRVDTFEALNANGTRASYTDYDQANAANHAYLQYLYNGTGVLLTATTVNDNGTRGINSYDTLGRVDIYEGLNADGTRANYTDWDQANASTTNYIQYLYNGTGVLLTGTTAYDNGTRGINVYDALGRVDTYEGLNANGTRANYTDYDQANAANHNYLQYLYNGTGVLLTATTAYDNGTRGENSYDAQGRVDMSKAFNAAGVLTTLTDYDQANTENWSIDVTTYDAQGRLDTETVNYDNATKSWIDYDTAGRVDTVYTYDTAGRTDYVYGFDDNSVLRYQSVWDDGARMDGAYVYGANGLLDYATTYNDSNVRTGAYAYDDGGRFDSAISFDSANRIDTIATFDDASRLDWYQLFDDANHATIAYDMDEAGRTDYQFYFNANNTLNYAYGFDNFGRVTSHTDYDAYGRIDFVTFYSTNTNQDVIRTIDYNPATLAVIADSGTGIYQVVLSIPIDTSFLGLF